MQVATGADRPSAPSAVEGLTAQIGEIEEGVSGLMETVGNCHQKLFGNVPVEPRGGADAPPQDGAIFALTSRLSEVNASIRWVREVLSHIDNQAG